MKRCVVIGGGIAGLTSAAYLAQHGIKVLLLESSPKLGGRAYSFKDQKTNDVIDNGQHILMGCYSDTIRFLKIIGAIDNFTFQKNLKINFLKPGNQIVRLNSITSFYPFNLLLALLNFKAVSFIDRLSLLRFIIKLPFMSHQKIIDKNVKEWLENEKQSEVTIKSLWEIITVGALNTNIDKASALMFREILLKIFFKGNFASTIILPKYGLSESYVNDAKDYIENNNGIIRLSSKIEKLVMSNGKISEIVTTEETISNFDYVISAIPFYALQKLLPDLFSDEEIDFQYSSILNVHIRLKKNPLKEPFYGLINSPVHWIFNKNSHLNLVISDADYLMERSAEEIYDLCVNELKKYIPIEETDILDLKILKEKRATFIPSNKIIFTRPSSSTKIKNLFLAGDWTDTGLPSTIESAVKSGRIAAEQVINSRN